MKINCLILGAMALITSAQIFADDRLLLSCNHVDRSETQLMQQAPVSVKRLKAHTLQVNWQGGVKQFKDKPPYDDALGEGETWRYCAYNPMVQMHLIQNDGGGLLTGVLLNQATGKMLWAGQEVRFSPDLQLFFATRQPDGLDSEEWLLSTMTGKTVWQGTSNALNKSHEVIAVLDQPSWNSQNQLQASLRCTAQLGTKLEKRQRVTLVQMGQTFDWQPKVACK
jgi:hypothetical protein